MQIEITNQLRINMETSSVIYVDFQGGERTIRLTQPEANILIFLTERRGDIISKDQLIDTGWSGKITGGNSLNVAIYNLRRYLSVDNQVQLENVPKKGYRLNVIENITVAIYEDKEYKEYKEDKNAEKDKDEHHKIITESVPINSIAIRIKIVTLILCNLILLKFVLTTFLNLVWVECKSSADSVDEVCFSKNYAENKELIEVPQGFSVISNNFYSNTNE